MTKQDCIDKWSTAQEFETSVWDKWQTSNDEARHKRLKSAVDELLEYVNDKNRLDPHPYFNWTASDKEEMLRIIEKEL